MANMAMICEGPNIELSVSARAREVSTSTYLPNSPGRTPLVDLVMLSQVHLECGNTEQYDEEIADDGCACHGCASSRPGAIMRHQRAAGSHC